MINKISETNFKCIDIIFIYKKKYFLKNMLQLPTWELACDYHGYIKKCCFKILTDKGVPNKFHSK